RLQLVVQQRLEQLRQAELKHVQARIGVDQVVGDLRQSATLRRSRTPQRREDLLQGRQSQHGIEIVSQRGRLLNDCEVVGSQSLREDRHLTITNGGVATQKQCQHQGLCVPRGLSELTEAFG